MVFDANITTHLAVDGQLAVLREQEVILERVIRSFSMVCAVNPTYGIPEHIVFRSGIGTRISAGVGATADVYAFAAIRSITDIELILLIFQLDVEIVATRYACLELVAIAGKARF